MTRAAAPDPVFATPVTGVPRTFEAEAVSRGRMVAQQFFSDWRALVGLGTVVVLFALAYITPHFGYWQYDMLDDNARLLPPSATHWFGTSQLGHDMFAVTMRGLQKSLIIGLVGALLATSVAAVVGAFAGYYGGRLNFALTALIDLLLVLPSFLIIAILSPSFSGKTWLVFLLLLAAFQWMITARIVRGMTLSLKEQEFVQAARFMGVPGRTIIFRHILPNMASILIIDATVNVSALILAEVGLSFFGFGVQPPDVSLGAVIYTHYGAAFGYPWEFYFPAGFLVVLLLAVNLVGDGLRDAFDPNSVRGSR